MGGIPPYQYSLDNETFNGTGTFLGIFAGTYPVYVRDAGGCAYELQVTVTEPDPISVDLGPDLDLTFGDSLQLEALISNAAGTVSYNWRGGYEGTLSCDSCAMPTVSPEFTIDYFLTVIDENGCVAEDRVRVNVRKDRVVAVPTAFTPNGDGNNDRLLVHGLPSTQVDVFRVFDRWGQLLFEDVDFPVNAADRGWDGFFRGQPMQSGVYLWQAVILFPDGSEEVYSGQTTLIR
jgi:gliding motility-associated-like protein